MEDGAKVGTRLLGSSSQWTNECKEVGKEIVRSMQELEVGRPKFWWHRKTGWIGKPCKASKFNFHAPFLNSLFTYGTKAKEVRQRQMTTWGSRTVSANPRAHTEETFTDDSGAAALQAYRSLRHRGGIRSWKVWDIAETLFFLSTKNWNTRKRIKRHTSQLWHTQKTCHDFE